nr:YutD family protein [Salinicoccus albus]
MITINHMYFELIEDYRDAFDEEQFVDKYSEVLNKYDYVVGDIGYEKLRLAGFFRDSKTKAERDKKFSAIQDYLYEYCNFGCAYFVVRKLSKSEIREKQEQGELPDPKMGQAADADEISAASDARDQEHQSSGGKRHQKAESASGNKTLAQHESAGKN